MPAAKIKKAKTATCTFSTESPPNTKRRYNDRVAAQMRLVMPLGEEMRAQDILTLTKPSQHERASFHTVLNNVAALPEIFGIEKVRYGIYRRIK